MSVPNSAGFGISPGDAYRVLRTGGNLQFVQNGRTTPLKDIIFSQGVVWPIPPLANAWALAYADAMGAIRRLDRIIQDALLQAQIRMSTVGEHTEGIPPEVYTNLYYPVHGGIATGVRNGQVMAPFQQANLDLGLVLFPPQPNDMASTSPASDFPLPPGGITLGSPRRAGSGAGRKD